MSSPRNSTALIILPPAMLGSALIIHNKGEQRSPRLKLVMAAITTLLPRSASHTHAPCSTIFKPWSRSWLNQLPAFFANIPLLDHISNPGANPEELGQGEDIELIRGHFFGQWPRAKCLPPHPIYWDTWGPSSAAWCNVTLFLDWMFQKKRAMVTTGHPRPWEPFSDHGMCWTLKPDHYKSNHTGIQNTSKIALLRRGRFKID